MNIEREKERDVHRKKYQAEIQKLEERTRERQALKAEFYALFPMTDSQKRGKSLESILNRIFSHYSMLVKEAFTVKGLGYDGVVEQIDGLIELDSHLYFVEMKWWNKPIGVAEVAQPLVRVFSRPNETRCVFISASGYTEPAIETFRQATQQRICIMCGLQEFVQILESEKDLRDLIRKKTQAAIAHRNPWHQCFNEL
jgi:restriction system protein